MLFKIVRTSEFGVLLESYRLQCKDKSVRLSSEQLFELTSSLFCQRKATGIVVINTRCFSRIFAGDNLLFYWSLTGSGVKIRASGWHSRENASQVSKLLLELTSSLCCRFDQDEMLFKIIRT